MSKSELKLNAKRRWEIQIIKICTSCWPVPAAHSLCDTKNKTRLDNWPRFLPTLLKNLNEFD